MVHRGLRRTSEPLTIDVGQDVRDIVSLFDDAAVEPLDQQSPPGGGAAAVNCDRGYAGM
jgi:hypothetical protein